MLGLLNDAPRPFAGLRVDRLPFRASHRPPLLAHGADRLCVGANDPPKVSTRAYSWSRRHADLWIVYALIDPRDGKPFYIGCTTRPKDRLTAHGCDPASAAWPRMVDIRALELRATMKIVGRYRDKTEARIEERRRIKITPGILNLEACPLGCLCGRHGAGGPNSQNTLDWEPWANARP